MKSICESVKSFSFIRVIAISIKLYVLLGSLSVVAQSVQQRNCLLKTTQNSAETTVGIEANGDGTFRMMGYGVDTLYGSSQNGLFFAEINSNIDVTSVKMPHVTNNFIGKSCPNYMNFSNSEFLRLRDGNYLELSMSTDCPSNDINPVIAKYTPAGGLIWSKEYKLLNNSLGIDLAPYDMEALSATSVAMLLRDNDTLAIAIINSNTGSVSSVIAYSGMLPTEHPISVRQFSNGDLLISHFAPTTMGLYLTRITPSGTVLWSYNVASNVYDNSYPESSNTLYVHSNDDISLMTTYSSSSSDFTLVRYNNVTTSSIGGVAFSKTYSSASNFSKLLGFKFDTAENVYYVMNGVAIGEPAVTKIDDSGNTIWAMRYSYTNATSSIFSDIAFSDSVFVAVGVVSSASGRDARIVSARKSNGQCNEHCYFTISVNATTVSMPFNTRAFLPTTTYAVPEFLQTVSMVNLPFTLECSNCCPTVTNNTISANQTICQFTSASTLNGSLPVLTPPATILYQWQVSTDSFSWSNISGAISQNYMPGTLSQTSWYRRIVYTTSCSGDTSANVKITVILKPNAGADRTVNCYLTGSATMAATGTGVWSLGAGSAGTATISNTSSPTTTVSGFSAAGTYYMIWTSNTCKDTAIITANNSCSCPITNNTITTPGSSSCLPFSGTTLNGSAASPAGGIYLWQRDSGGGYVAAPGTNNTQNYTTGSLSVGNYSFRRIYTITGGSACSDTSDVVILQVNATPNISAVNINCIGNTGTANLVVNATISSGTLEYSLDGGVYQSSNTFSAVSNGSHLVVVRNVGTPCIATQSVTINCPAGASCNIVRTKLKIK